MRRTRNRSTPFVGMFCSMGIKAQAWGILKSIFSRYGYDLYPTADLYEWQKSPIRDSCHNESALPDGAALYLNPTNPRLVELQDRYNLFGGEVTVPLLWHPGYVTSDDLRYFRGDNAYLWQLRGPNMNIMSYALATYYIASIDRRSLLVELEEDDCFGNFLFDIAGRQVSRDLLDSILEIYFLDKHLQIASKRGFKILDIGAGYGRLAHRMVRAYPNIGTYFCTDAVAVSTFLSEYYLRFRNLGSRARVIPLDEIERTLSTETIDLAVNIHSFSECTIAAIAWWISRLAKAKVKHLMIVPNGMDHAGERFVTNERKDMGEVVRKHGYQLIAREPKFTDPVVQKYGMNPTHYYLFELTRT